MATNGISKEAEVTSSNPCHACYGIRFKRITTEKEFNRGRQQVTFEVCLGCGASRPLSTLKIYTVKTPPDRRKLRRG